MRSPALGPPEAALRTEQLGCQDCFRSLRRYFYAVLAHSTKVKTRPEGAAEYGLQCRRSQSQSFVKIIIRVLSIL